MRAVTLAGLTEKVYFESLWPLLLSFFIGEGEGFELVFSWRPRIVSKPIFNLSLGVTVSKFFMKRGGGKRIVW